MTTTNLTAATYLALDIIALRAEISSTISVAVDAALVTGGIRAASEMAHNLLPDGTYFSTVLYTVAEMYNHVQGEGTAQYDHSRRWGGVVCHVQDNLTRVTTHLLDGQGW